MTTLDANSAFEQLREASREWTTLDEAAFDSARDSFQLKEFEKNEILVRPGEPARYVYFLTRGLVRMYYEAEGGKQTNKSFARENMFVSGSIMPGGGQSDFGVEALESTSTLMIAMADLQRLATAEPAWGNLINAYIAWLAGRKARREKQRLLESAEERYLGFKEDFPDIAERIPQYHAALYLGITDVALSRIKKRITSSS